ncbi:uncharacterized protein I303_104990 [Kwoniella dejecticola CBS 10117]|uniref:galacturonan 1,4-alpha-galacturonidase n=1 Tax=Kwoniella dejecticola CBS 10117 TaxID=1296121 RepID=A0A1A6A3S8_9TREE|nr:uncharacterized protein I303_05565 [Kwoniella dejecticola CBS 10117]OBR84706.1 hypothetical protein I303_05565 [Kwoniella dejecticola CBS 10117]
MFTAALLTILGPLVASAAYTPLGRSGELQSRNNGQTCTVQSGGSNSTDDSQSFRDAAKQCANGGTLLFQEGVDYYFNTPVNATLNNVDIQFKGNVHLPQNLTYVQGIVNGSTGGNTWWINLTGDNLNFTGTTNLSTGWVYGYGQQWWDANPKNGSGLAARPHLWRFNMTNGNIKNIKIRKPIAWVTTLNGNNINVDNVFVDAATTPGGGFPFNTDGFDVAAKNVKINDFTIFNGDDAVTINNGGENVTVTNGFIAGPGCHGTSIGSLGQAQGVYQTVRNILFDNIKVHGCVYGSRIKTYLGGQGMVQNVTFSNYAVSNTTFPIYLTQNYFNQGSSQTQNGAGVQEGGNFGGRVDNSSVLIDGVTYKNWYGDINTYQPGDGSCVTDPCWYDVPGADGTQAIVIGCSNSTACSNFEFQNIQVIPQSYATTQINCTNLESGSNPKLGIVCTNGTLMTN